MQRPKIIRAIPIADELVTELESACDVIPAPDGGWTFDSVRDALPGADGVLINGMFRVDRNWLDRGGRLRVVSNRGAGLDNIDLPYATERGVVICNTPGVLSGAVADLVFSMILTLSRRLAEAQLHITSGAWAAGGPAPVGHDVRGKVLGLLGLGSIAKEVARTAAAFDMKVIYHQPRRIHELESAGKVQYVSREELFRQSDFLSVHCSLTSETKSSIGLSDFQLMRPSAYFINTSRGLIVKEVELIEALERKLIAGAGLDVMEKEPLAPESPLCRMTNVVLMPHAGSLTHETRRAMEDLAVRNLLDGLAGRTPVAVANPAVLHAAR